MIRFILFLSFLISISVDLFAEQTLQGLNKEQQAWLKQHPVIKVHNESDYIPVNFYKNNKPQGYSIDYINLLAKKIGIEINFVSGYTWNQYLQMAKEKKIDVVLNVVKTKPREEYLKFTQTYLKLYPFIYSNDNEPIKSLEELNGKTLAIPKGYYFENLFEQNYPNIKLLKVADNLNSLKAVSLGEADATVGLSTTFEHLKNEHFINNVSLTGEAKLKGMSKYFEKIGVRSDWKIFQEILDIAINSVTYEEQFNLRKKWNLTISSNKNQLTFTREELKWLKENEEIKVYNENDWAPYNYNENNISKGYSIDYMNLLASKLDLKVKYISDISWSNSLDMLENNSLDLLLNIAKTTPRLKRFDFTNKWYLKVQNGFVSRKNSSAIKQYSQLEGKVLCIVEGYAIDDTIKKEYPLIKLLVVKNNTELIKAVSYGHADAGHGTIGSLQYVMSENFITNLKFHEDNKEQNQLYIAVNKGNDTLLSLLNKAQKILKNDEILKLKKKWFFSNNQEKQISFTQTERKWIEEHPIVKVGGETDWPPFDYVENGKYTGIAKDYLDVISKKTGIIFDVKTGYTWSELINMMKNKQIDLLPMLYFSESRKKFVNFTDSYLNVRHYLYTSIDKDFNRLTDLNGKTVAVPKGFAQADILKKEYPNIKIYEADNSLDCIDAVITKKADAFIENTALVSYLLKLHKIKGIKAAFATELGVNKLYMASRKDWSILRDIIQKSLKSFSDEDNKIIAKRWFSQDEKSETKSLFTLKQKKYLKDKEKITMCVSKGSLPIESIVNDKHIGITADFIKEIEKVIKKDITLLETKDFAQTLKFTKEKKCDLIPSITKSKRLDNFLSFTKPYMSFPTIILTSDDKPFISSLDLLKDKTIALHKSSELIYDLQNRYPKMKVVEVDSTIDGIKGLKSNQFYGYIDSTVCAYYNINKNAIEGIKIASFLDNNLELSMAVDANNEILHDILQIALNNISDKVKQKTIKNWVDIEFKKDTDYSYLINLVVFSIIVIVVLLIVSFLLKRKINEEVEKKLELQTYATQIDAIINGSWTIQLLYDDQGVFMTNNAFLNFFNRYKSYEEFNAEHTCVSSFFEYIDDNEYITNKYINDKLWIEYLLENKDIQYKVAIKKDDQLFYFIIHVNDIILQNKKYYLVELIDISHEIEQREDLNKKNQIIAEQSKMAEMGEMIGNIAHQWRQPLSVISTAATGIQIEKEFNLLTDDDLITKCELINNNAQYLSKTIDDFRNFIKGDRNKSIFNLDETIKSCVSILEVSLKSHNIKVVYNIDKSIKIDGFENELIQCLINMINNSKDAFEDINENHRVIFIDTSIENEKNAIIKLKDNAGGIPEDIISKVFDPYFTTKHQSQGTGLGLHMAYNIILNGMGGTIEAHNVNYKYDDNDYTGAEFTITLPMS